MSRAAFYHDFGKAAVFFQEKMYGGSPENWYRHELFSLLIGLSLDAEQSLLPEELAAIATHHKNLKAVERDGSPGLCAWTEDAAEVQLRQLTDEQLRLHWSAAKRVFGALPTRLNTKRVVAFLRSLRDTAEISSVWTDTGRQLARHRGALVAADHLASSGVGDTIRGDNIRVEPLEQYMKTYCTPTDGSEWAGWSQSQQEAASAIGPSALIAPTGAGKTEAALLWALTNRTGGERIFYVLPYQVSINAMAERLARVFPDESGHGKLRENANVSVLHSNMDLAYLQDALDDQLPMDKAVSIARANKGAARKIYSPIKVTTVYQLLGIFFGRKFFEVGLLELTNSLVIFDEVHAYDGHTLGLLLVLLRYLQKLGARVFIMTATLPGKLQSSLFEAAGIPQDAALQLAANDPLRKEVRRRVRLLPHNIESPEVIRRIKIQLGRRKRVVVVCNTVDKAIRMCTILEKYAPYLVHSRFTLGDRAERERKDVIGKQRLVVSTQVIEVSLDVSFDVMFTELAPADSLIQRMGRVNRHGPAKSAAPVYIACAADKGSEIIYGAPILAASHKEFLELAARRNPERATPVGSASLRGIAVDFQFACDWMEAVYPDGLPPDQLRVMKDVESRFEGLVKDLRPMIDPPANVDLELTLFATVQVVPIRFANEWRKYKANGCHLEAKRLIVNVNTHAWRGAKNRAYEQGYVSVDEKISDKPWEPRAALFDYDVCGKTGLRLDKPLRPDPGSQMM